MFTIRRTSHVVLQHARRPYATLPPRPKRTRRTVTLALSALSGAAILGLYTDARSCPRPPFQLIENDLEVSASLPTLLRTYLVYGLMSCETLVDRAPELLDALLRMPLVGPVVESIVRRTFFDHFVGGDTARAAFPLLSTLRSQNKGALFAYSVEVDAHKATGTPPNPETRSRSENLASQPIHKRIVAEMLRSIDMAAEFEDEWNRHTHTHDHDVGGRRTWVAVKLTALLPNADALRKLSLHLTRTRPAQRPPVPFPGTPGSSDLAVLDTRGRIPDGSPLTVQNVHELRELYEDLNRICTRARDQSVRVILDAEHSWYQPAIDAFGHGLMERFNKLPRNTQEAELQPIVYVTYQAYLRRTPAHLAHSLSLARNNNYALGVKLVRGAYHPHELAVYDAQSLGMSSSVGISPDPYPPVQPSKLDTDTCYDACAALLVQAIAEDMRSSRGRAPRIGVLFGTHNWKSSELILGELVRHGLADRDASDANGDRKGTVTVPDDVAKRLTFGQLYGMSDSLTNYLVGRMKSTTPCVVKYVPYGALAEVMPYISRRAIENKSVLGNGGAVRERKEAARQIWTRVFGGIGL